MAYISFPILVINAQTDGLGISPNSLGNAQYELCISTSVPSNVEQLNINDLIVDHAGISYKVLDWQDVTYSSGLTPTKSSALGFPAKDAYTSTDCIYIKVEATNQDVLPTKHPGNWVYGSGGASIVYVEPIVVEVPSPYTPDISWFVTPTSISFVSGKTDYYNCEVYSNLDPNSIGEGKIKIGYYLISSSGYAYEITDVTILGDHWQIEVFDVNRKGSPAANNVCVVYDGKYGSYLLSQGFFGSFLPSAIDVIRNANNAVIWKNRGVSLNNNENVTDIQLGEGLRLTEVENEVYQIIDGNQSLKTIIVDEDLSEKVFANDKIKITSSTGNNGVYTVEEVVYDTETTITLKDNLLSSTIDGDLNLLLSEGWLGGKKFILESDGSGSRAGALYGFKIILDKKLSPSSGSAERSAIELPSGWVIGPANSFSDLVNLNGTNNDLIIRHNLYMAHADVKILQVVEGSSSGCFEVRGDIAYTQSRSEYYNGNPGRAILLSNFCNLDDKLILSVFLTGKNEGEPELAIASEKYVETIYYTDNVNKIIKLTKQPLEVGETIEFTPYGATDQNWGEDYTVREVIGCDNSANNGYYICLSPDSTAPDNGYFNGGVNPTIGIEEMMEIGDSSKASYFVEAD